MSATLLDIGAVRGRYSALDRPLAFFDGPGGTQCPDEVIDAIPRPPTGQRQYRRAVRNLRRDDALVEHAPRSAASFMNCNPGEVAFGQSMTSMNFLLRALLPVLSGPATRYS